MKATTSIALCSVVVMLLILSYDAEVTMAATCKAVELSPCLAAMQSSRTPPSKLCCTKIRQQKPCLCQYVKNPFLKKFVSSPNAKKVSATCRVPFPKC